MSGLPAGPSPTKHPPDALTLLPFQAAGVRWLNAVDGRGLLADDMGLGKTIQTLAWLATRPDLRPAVVVCPAGLKLNWYAEAGRWLRPGERVAVVDGFPAGRTLPRASILIINYDILAGWAAALSALHPAIVVLDECHYVKNRTKLRSRAAAAINSPRVLGLSGTPMQNNHSELWMPLSLIAPGLLPAWTPFTRRFCNAKWRRAGRRRYWDVSGCVNAAELHALIAPVTLRRTKAEVLPQLPAKRRSVLPLPLDPAAQRDYLAAEGDFRSWLRAQGDPERTARALRAVTFTRMEQLKQLAVRAKLPAALAWIADAAEQAPLVVFAHHHFILDAITARLTQAGVRLVRIDGSVTGPERQERVRLFQCGEARVFLGQTKAAGVGLTLTAGYTVAFLELGWTPAEHDQAEDRLYGRVNDPHGINSYYLLAAGTVEEDIAALLDRKRADIAATMDGGTAPQADELLIELLHRLAAGNLRGSGV